MGFDLPAVVERFRFAAGFVVALDVVDFVPAAPGALEREAVAFVLFVEAARLADVADDFAVDRRGDDVFFFPPPPMGSASPTALTAALAASPTVSTTFPAVRPAFLPTVPAVLPTVFTTSPG